MSKKQESDSSLELLLDTMCNTFGAVVFIAISLTILVSMTSKVETTVTKKEDISKMKQELADVTKLLEQLQKTTDDSEKLAEKLKSDPRRNLISQMVLLNQMKDKVAVEVDLLKTQADIVTANLRDAENDFQLADKALQATTDDLQVAEKTIEEQTQRILKLKEDLRTVAPYQMAFIRMRESDRSPYFLIVKNNRIYEIGPNIDDFTKTSSDVNAVVEGDKITCTVASAAQGIPMLDADRNLSAEFHALLSKINREKRVPDFSIYGDSLAVFCKFRQLLKQKGILHGVNTKINEENKFTYQIVHQKVKNEY